MGLYKYIFINTEGQKKESYVKGSSWKIANKRFEAENENKVKEIIRASKQS